MGRYKGRVCTLASATLLAGLQALKATVDAQQHRDGATESATAFTEVIFEATAGRFLTDPVFITDRNTNERFQTRPPIHEECHLNRSRRTLTPRWRPKKERTPSRVNRTTTSIPPR